jgi:hypothetical protein
MTRRSGSDENPQRGLEPRPRRAPRLRYLAAATFVLVTIVGGAGPAVGTPCNEKPTKAAPADGCKGKGGGRATGAAGGKRGSGNGKASGHGDPHTGTNKSGGSGDAGGATRDRGHGGRSKKAHHRRQQSDGSADDTKRTRSSKKHRQAQTSAYDHPLQRRPAFPVETTTSRPSLLVDPATEADGDVAGPQLPLDVGEVRQPNSAQGARLLSTALTTVETMAFPISLAFLVGAFLFVQAYIDRNDPKLREAALRREVYEFV